MKFRQNELITHAWDYRGRRLKRNFFTPNFTSYATVLQLDTIFGPCFLESEISDQKLYGMNLALGQKCCQRKFKLLDWDELTYRCRKCGKISIFLSPGRIPFYQWSLKPQAATLEYNASLAHELEDWFPQQDGLETLWLGELFVHELEQIRIMIQEKVSV